jgi:hypothetical protein
MVAISPACAQDGVGNLPPEVSITWPVDRFYFTTETLKIKATASDTDGSITQVQFVAIVTPLKGSAETNVIGVVTNPPYNILWNNFFPCGNYITLIAVTEDDLGTRTESAPVVFAQLCGPPASSVLQIVSPKDGALLAAPATFTFSAEILVSGFGTVAAQFFVGTNLVGEVITNMTATGPPVSLTVSNLPAGEYKLSVRDRYANLLPNKTINIRVVNLGVQLPRLTLDGRFQFDIVTSYPGRQTVIQASENLLDWVPISTNQPSSNTFTFTESSPATNFHRFYRAFLPPE